jgi:hypothetical protein
MESRSANEQQHIVNMQMSGEDALHNGYLTTWIHNLFGAAMVSKQPGLGRGARAQIQHKELKKTGQRLSQRAHSPK